MRIDCGLNADVDPVTREVARSDFAFQPEAVFHRAVIVGVLNQSHTFFARGRAESFIYLEPKPESEKH
jgi:hypothetical protein